jgi:hypothetical protein
MKISEVLANVDELRPNQFDENIKIKWLSDLDGRVFNTIIMTHEHSLVENPEDGTYTEPTFTRYDETSENEDLLIPDTYADTYTHYIFAQMDYTNGEDARYVNSMAMFNSSLGEYANWYNSTHKPLQVKVQK